MVQGCLTRPHSNPAGSEVPVDNVWNWLETHSGTTVGDVVRFHVLEHASDGVGLLWEIRTTRRAERRRLPRSSQLGMTRHTAIGEAVRRPIP